MTRRRSASSGRPLSSICTGARKPRESRSVGHVVDLAVADEDGAGDAARRQIGDRLGQCGEEPRAAAIHRLAGRLVAGMDDAKLQPGDRLDALLDLGQSGGRLLAARRRCSGSRNCRPRPRRHRSDICGPRGRPRDWRVPPASAAQAIRRQRLPRARRQKAIASRITARIPPATSRGQGSSGANSMLRVPKLIGPASPGSPAHAPGRICNCRSGHTSRG